VSKGNPARLMERQMTNPALPATITLDYQPYGCVTLGNLSWGIERERNWNGGPDHVRTVLKGTVLSGEERGYLFGEVSRRDATGQSRTVYGVREDEIARGHIVRVAG
jgi:hypothetical protein